MQKHVDLRTRLELTHWGLKDMLPAVLILGGGMHNWQYLNNITGGCDFVRSLWLLDAPHIFSWPKGSYH